MNFSELEKLFAAPGTIQENGGHEFKAGLVEQRRDIGFGIEAVQWWRAETCCNSFYCDAHGNAAKPGLRWHAGGGTCAGLGRAAELTARYHVTQMAKARALIAKFGGGQ